VNVERVELTDSYKTNIPGSEDGERIPTPREVLEELFHLLEDYAPTWYTEEHHNHAVAALRGATQPKTSDPEKSRGKV
jgi:hypothetical protein